MAKYIDSEAFERRCMFDSSIEDMQDVIYALRDYPAADVVPVRKCNECNHYDGVKRIPGHAPCSFWKIGGVLWNDYCSRWDGA